MTTLGYRPEIDGLRALAVVPVLLFHGGFSTFSGGFVGVDVFFVISGYLITTIIQRELANETFTLGSFYERRARRILPALSVVMLACIPFAWHSMLPDDLENFGQSLVATTLFSNNILLLLTSGYFALENEFKPLLHTWSLGVEEQYYLLIPLIMLGLSRTGRGRAIPITIVALGLASYLIAVWQSGTQPVAAFYLLHTRAWELMAGAVAAYLGPAIVTTIGWRKPAVKSFCSVLGLLLIGFAVLFFDENTPVPSAPALIPVSGAVLVILCADHGNIAGRILASKVLVAIGLISYSLYLWHQPALVFLRLYSLEEPTKLAYAGTLMLSVILAALTWRYIEVPFRNRDISFRKLAPGMITVGAITAGTGLLLHVNSGFVETWTELGSDVQSAGRNLNAVYNQQPFKYLDAPFTESGRPKVLILGDSFARDFINSALENSYLAGAEISYRDSYPGCSSDPSDLQIDLRSRFQQADFVVFGSPPAVECWPLIFQMARKLGVDKLVVIGTKNFGWNMNAAMRLDTRERQRYRAKVLSDVIETNQELADGIGSAYYVDLLKLLSDQSGRVPVFTPDGKVISQDRRHLTKAGAKYIGEILFEHPLLAPLRNPVKIIIHNPNSLVSSGFRKPED